MKCRRLSRTTGAVTLSFIFGGCTSMSVSDCPSPEHWYNPFSVLGHNVPRVRSAKYRMAMADVPRAATRFAPYALMSAYAYFDKEDCPNYTKDPAKKEKLRVAKERIQTKLDAFNQPDSFKPVFFAEGNRGCEDALGLMYHVWHSEKRNELVIAFRGTSNAPDWWYGNLWPVSHLVSEKTQYSKVQEQVDVILKAAKADPDLASAKVIVTGHSLGGGLAQHALYSYPKGIHQAVVFDPSIITGYTTIKGSERVTQCNCTSGLGAEAPIIRVYESNEILSNLRIFHKIFYPAHLHIQEVRFNYDSSIWGTHSHSIDALSRALAKDAIEPQQSAAEGWYASTNASCTAEFKEAQVKACDKASEAAICRISAPERH